MQKFKKDAMRKQAEVIIRNLEKRNMEGYFCETSEEAVKLVLGMMEEGSVVTWGGSETFTETGMADAVKNGNFKLLDRNAADAGDPREFYAKQVCSDYFFMSANAITLSGELVNIDGNGNRVACLITGPKYVIVLAGMNKVVYDEKYAVERIRNVASPANALRLGTNTPCELTGCCADCHSPKCMCCHIVTTRHSRHKGRIKVILINEELGY